MVVALVIFVLLSVIACYAMIITVEKGGEDKITSLKNISDNIDAIIVLGAGIRYDGIPCAVLRDRLKMAVKVYKKTPNAKILLSGDHGRKNYNEVKSMKRYIMENYNINESNIFLDHAGFSTYDTMYRAESIFKIKKAIVVTNRYHLPRVIYIGKSRGIDAIGIPSDMRIYPGIKEYRIREKIAQIKDFLYVNILKPKPTYLGDEIPIKLVDGRITDDEL